MNFKDSLITCYSKIIIWQTPTAVALSCSFRPQLKTIFTREDAMYCFEDVNGELKLIRIVSYMKTHIFHLTWNHVKESILVTDGWSRQCELQFESEAHLLELVTLLPQVFIGVTRIGEGELYSPTSRQLERDQIISYFKSTASDRKKELEIEVEV